MTLHTVTPTHWPSNSPANTRATAIRDRRNQRNRVSWYRFLAPPPWLYTSPQWSECTCMKSTFEPPVLGGSNACISNVFPCIRTHVHTYTALGAVFAVILIGEMRCAGGCGPIVLVHRQLMHKFGKVSDTRRSLALSFALALSFHTRAGVLRGLLLTRVRPTWATFFSSVPTV